MTELGKEQLDYDFTENYDRNQYDVDFGPRYEKAHNAALKDECEFLASLVKDKFQVEATWQEVAVADVERGEEFEDLVSKEESEQILESAQKKNLPDILRQLKEQPLQIQMTHANATNLLQREIAIDFQPYLHDNKLADKFSQGQIDYIGFTDPLLNKGSIIGKNDLGANYELPNFQYTSISTSIDSSKEVGVGNVSEKEEEYMSGSEEEYMSGSEEEVEPEQWYEAKPIAIRTNTFSYLMHLPTAPPLGGYGCG